MVSSPTVPSQVIAVGNVGGTVGPSLNDVVGRQGGRFVRQKLMDPTFNSRNSMMPNFGLSDQQIEALVAYLATMGGTN